jgi:DNA-3-methyladenine glycosylase II
MLQRAIRHLRRADPVMRGIIARVGPCRLTRRRNHFLTLVRAIIAQQISGKAAASIRQRVVALVAPGKLTPEALARLTPEQLRAAGVSPQKTRYLLDLAQKVAGGEVHLKRLARRSDEAIIAELIKIKGIGVWTVQMFLIFSLGRPDVLPYDDLGVRTAIRRHYGFQSLPGRRTCERIARAWRPYASVASWYCWRALELPPDKSGRK